MALKLGKGWHNESHRHSLARKGIKTGRKQNYSKLRLTSEQIRQKHHAEIEKYNGWTNRETWAVKLHWDNNYGDYQHFTGEAKKYKKAGKSPYEFADYLKETAEDIRHNVIYEPENASEEAKNFVDDVGSLERVNWNEIAESYYEEVE